jgi:tRNA nucleotidyltransferase (CCA-adding enzyme)
LSSLQSLAPARAHDPVLQKLPDTISIYCVGGAVRDALMDCPSEDRDYLVVGATPEVMAKAGFRPVGADFPVFLHPQTHAEYALARTERKSAPGYKGFVFHASPEVSLQDDLARRDLTINAMAVDIEGRLLDPFGGQKDLAEKTLRHVSPAFSEDPVRLLRLARFLARWPEFKVAPETADLCRDMVRQGEVDALVPERTWQELWRGLEAVAPQAMMDFLAQVDGYWAVTGHPPLSPADTNLLARLRDAGLPTALIAAWLWGKTSPGSIGARLGLPREVSQWARLISRGSPQPPLHQALVEWPQAVVEWAETADLFRHPQWLAPLLLFGRLLSQEPSDGDQKDLYTQWERLARSLIEVPVGDVAKAAAAAGKPVGEAVRAHRRAFVTQALGAR